MHRSSRSGLLAAGLAAVAALAALAACGDDSTGSTPPPPDISGPWVLTVAFGYHGTCIIDGSAQVDQESDRFTAQFSDSLNLCGFTLDTIVHGEIDGDKVLATGERCTYGSNVSGSAPDHLYGSLICSVRIGAQSVRRRAHWWFTRSTDSPSMADISGDWILLASIGYVPEYDSYTCGVYGTFQLAQSGDSVKGQAVNSEISCGLPYPPGSVNVPWIGQLANDSFTASTTVDLCTYAGTIRGSPPNRMSGELSCRFHPYYDPEDEDTLSGPGELARLSASSPAAD